MHSVPSDEDLLRLANENAYRAAGCCVLKENHLYCCVSSLLQMEQTGCNEPLWVLFRQIFAEGLQQSSTCNIALFHGAMVQKGNTVLVLTAQSGMGKTTTVLRMREQGWKILADDMLIWDPDAEAFMAAPTWSAGLWNREHLFVADGLFYRPTCIFQLQRGKTGIEMLSLAEQLAALNEGFTDGFAQWRNGSGLDITQNRLYIFNMMEKILKQVPCYRLRVNLTETFDLVINHFLTKICP